MISFEMMAMDTGCSALEVTLYYVIGPFVAGRKYPCPFSSLSWTTHCICFFGKYIWLVVGFVLRFYV